MRTNPQCQTCVFNGDYFVAFCERCGDDHDCIEYVDKVIKRCAVCDVGLGVVEWFMFGDKCAIHGIED